MKGEEVGYSSVSNEKDIFHNLVPVDLGSYLRSILYDSKLPVQTPNRDSRPDTETRRHRRP